MSLTKTDPTIFRLIEREKKRQEETLMMIPSENYASPAVLAALGSVVQNKYAEGYPGKRYYQGNEFIDKIEILAQKRAQKIFGVSHVNVQPYSGSPANAAVYFALLEPGDKIMGLSLLSGGHLTHGHPKITFSGRYFQGVPYEVGEDGLLDYEKIEKEAIRKKPKIIVAGTTAYPRILDFKKFGQIADRVGAYLLADIAHIAGLVAAGAHPSPVPYAHVVTTTTHKTLRGPRGAMVMVTGKGLKKEPLMAKKIDRAVFPGLQGGPHENTIAAMAVALKEAEKESFRQYAYRVVKNACRLADALQEKGFNLVSGGTDNHLILVDLRNKNINGKKAAVILEKAGIIVNANSIPHDPRPPFRPSGIRLGTPALTTRGMKEEEMGKIAELIEKVISSPQEVGQVKKEVKKLTLRFPIYSREAL
ncbi:serine hydroxymethyltransferase [Candidatus Shapirobacteria bacterium]|nr:serine hydroxymethyltransferase [Candidatus Shapirobacteria bacterium]